MNVRSLSLAYGPPAAGPVRHNKVYSATWCVRVVLTGCCDTLMFLILTRLLSFVSTVCAEVPSLDQGVSSADCLAGLNVIQNHSAEKLLKMSKEVIKN